MENSNEFFILVCYCGAEFCPDDTRKCPVCKKANGNMKFNVNSFLERIYEHSAADRNDSALDIILDAFFNFWDRYDIMNEIMGKADVSKLNSTTMVGFMTQTFKYIKQVPNHLLFCDKAAYRMKELGKSEEEIKDLVDNYRETGTYWKDMKILGATGFIWGSRPEDS